MPRPTHLRPASKPEVLPPDSPYAFMGLCLRLAVWGLFLLLGIHPASAQFNGLNGIFALNSMTFGVMPTFTIITPGTGYASGDISTLNCPNTTIFTNPGGTMPTFTYNGTTWTLTTPGIGTFIPSSGTPTQKNGICTLTQSSTTGSGSGLSLLATFGFRSAGAAASGVNNDISALLGGQILLGPLTANGASPQGSSALTVPSTGIYSTNGEVTINSSPFGWGSTAAVLCVFAYQPSTANCPVTGGAVNPNGFATYLGRDVVDFVPMIYSPASIIIQGPPAVDPVNLAGLTGTFTATNFTLTTPLTAPVVAELAFRQRLTATDTTTTPSTVCYGTLDNWKTDGSFLMVYGWTCSGSSTVPSSVSTVRVDADPAALVGTWASATRFTLQTPLRSPQLALLRGGMPLDTNDNPVCSGTLTGWDAAGGTWVEAASGFYTQPSGASCTPAGTSVIIGDLTKVFAENTVTNLYSYSRAYKMAEEHDCDNNQRPVPYGIHGLQFGEVTSSHYELWCLDLVNLGTYGDLYAMVIRGAPTSGNSAFNDGIEIQAGISEAAIKVQPSYNQPILTAFATQSGVGANTITNVLLDSSSSGNIYAQMLAMTGRWRLGNQAQASSTATSPGFTFYSSGFAAGSGVGYDSSIIATGGSGTPGSGTITLTGLANFTTLNGTQFAIANGGSSTVNYWVCHGGTTGLPVACFPNSNGDSNQSVSIGARGSGFVFLGSTTDAGTGNSALQVGANGSMNSNRVTIFGASSGSPPIIGPTGGVDTNISLRLTTKGTGSIDIVPGVDSTNAFNVKNAAGSANILAVDSANSLVIIPSTSTLQFGTYATSCTVGGYTSIKDAGGTSRKLAVCN